jgi:hypothetical protein
MNTEQGALYAANAAVASHESQLRYAEETRSRLESQHTERRAQLGSWREQRAQLTQALHMWAARSGTARDRAAQAKRKLEQENGLRPRPRRIPCRPGRRKRARSGRKSESGLRSRRPTWGTSSAGGRLSQRRERLDAEPDARRPDAAAASAAAGRNARGRLGAPVGAEPA